MSENGSRGSRRWSRNRSGRTQSGVSRHELEPEDHSPQGSLEDDVIIDGNETNNAVAADSIISPTSTNIGVDEDYFVTSPPKRSGLTGSISTLFRRAASREPQKPSKPSVSIEEEEIDVLPSEPADDDAHPSSGDPEVAMLSSEADDDGEELVGVTSTEICSSPNPTSTQEEDPSVATSVHFSTRRTRTRSTKRIYSSYTDDDSDDSYDDYKSEAISRATTKESEYYLDSESMDDDPRKRLKRYRGFSTSISSLFLDESLVCTSIGCFGLILSNRTEHLLQVRDHIRGVKSSKKNQTADKRTPSKVFSYLLLMTLMLMFLTFVIWGFGNGNALADDYLYNGGMYNVDTDDAAGASNQNNDANNNNNYKQDDYYVYEGDDQNANNDDDAVEYYQNYYDNRQNDDANAVNNDDAAADNYNNNDDANANANANDDGNNDNGNNNNNYDDDDANDDGANDNGNNNNYDDDDGANGNNNNNDDNANANDDAQQQNDDNVDNDDANGDDANAANNNDDGNDAVDNYYAAEDDDQYNARHLVQRRQPQSKPRGVDTHSHNAAGIFKLRDCQEGLWDPVIAFAKEQWRQEATATRSLSDVTTDDYTSADYSSPERDLASDIRTALLLTFLLFLGVLGRRRRMRTRFQLVRARAQDDRLYQMSGGRRRTSMKDELEDKAYEVACSHTILGCYPIDPPSEDFDEEELGVNEDGVTATRKKAPKHDDFVSRGFSCLMSCCCGYLCKCWFQCLSVCALAQEAREMRLLLPPRYQRIDFITHQPFAEYQKDVNELRRGWMGKKRKKSGILAHYNALSRLSRYILFTSGITLLFIVATLLFNPRAGFSWPDAVLLIATFVQSFLVLYIVHWIFHKSDLSLDAVIKFFAAGFVIAVPSAVFFEGLLVNMILASAWTVYELALSLFGENFALWMASNYRIIWILGELFNAYIVAAVTEELCKYYTFRSIEHPDLIFLTGLDRKSHDEHAAEGGRVAYPFGSHKVSDLNKSTSRSFESQRSNRSKESLEDKRKRILTSTNTTEEFYEDEHDVRTYRQKAAAVTTGMISVAVGLACAENMMYVFLLGGARGSSAAEHQGDVYEEWIVLLFRSVFPIHALAAAMQSTNMIRKFVEGTDHNNHRIGVGRIILPAVILHGTFDAILMGINVYVESAWDAYLEENEGRIDEDEEPYNPTVVNFVAWCSIVLVTLIGFLWFYRENRNQKQRLILLEEEEKAKGDEASYVSPAVESETPAQSKKKKKKEQQRRTV